MILDAYNLSWFILISRTNTHQYVQNKVMQICHMYSDAKSG